MDWGNLKHFVELARTGSLSAAARRLKVDHSTVARRIEALEVALGMKLFNRMARGYELTPEGERIASLAGPIEEQVFAIQRVAQGQSTGVNGTVRISAPPVFASHIIAPRLVPLRKAHPGLVIELIGEAAHINLIRREADIALRLSRPADKSLVARRIGALTYSLYCSRSYMDTCSERPEYLGYDDSFEDVPQQRWICRLAGEARLVFRSNDLAGLYQAVRAGMGVAALPDFLASNDNNLVRLPGDGSEATREIWLVVHPDLKRSQKIRVVMDDLVRVVGSLPRPT